MALQYTLINSNTEYEVSGGSCTAGAVVIPSTYNGKNVTRIGNSAFSGCSTITSIDIPNTVTRIGDYAFYNCFNLATAILPNTITTIGQQAFQSTKITTINISNVTTLGNLVFVYCVNLTSITLPTTLTTIPYGAFYGAGLSSINIPSNITTIGDNAFFVCPLTSISVDPNNGSYSSQDGVLYNKTKTILILYPKEKLNSSFFIPQTVNTIYSRAFFAAKFTGINIPNSVITIGEGAFIDCTNLTSITLPNGIVYLPEAVFNNCTSLTSVNLPNFLVTIGLSAFDNCTSLAAINIPNTVQTLGESCFYGTSLVNITIPDSVSVIEPAAFYNCANLTSVTLSKSITELSDSVFGYCTSLTSITIPDNVILLKSAFYGCSNLSNVTISKNLISIGDSAFFGCSNLSNITIPKNLITIGGSAFFGCSNLLKMTFLGNAPTFGTSALANTNANLKIYRYSTKTGWPSTIQSKEVKIIDENNKNLKTFGFESFSNGKISASKTKNKISFLGEVSIPTLISSAGNSSNYVFSPTDDIYFEAEVYINSNENVGPILEATSNTPGIANEFAFGISDYTQLGNRGVPAGSFFIYNGTRGGSLSAYYSSEVVPLNNWTKVAAQRVNGVWSIFINDIQYSVLRAVDAGIPNDQFGNSNLPVWVGRSEVGNFNIDGQIRNIILNNKPIKKFFDSKNLYFFDNISLLLPFDNNFQDYSKNNFVPENYGVQISTAQSKFGGASAYFNGNSSLVIPTSITQFNPFVNFTIEAWIYLTSATLNGIIGTADSGSLTFGIGQLGNLVFGRANQSVVASSANNAINLNQWYHVAISRNGAKCRLFINGTEVDSQIDGNAFSAPLDLEIGHFAGEQSWYFNGYIDELRITKGISLYNKDFIPSNIFYYKPGKIYSSQ